MSSPKVRLSLAIAAAMAASIVALPCNAVTHKIKGHIQCSVLDGASNKLVDAPRVRVRIENGAGQEAGTDSTGMFEAAVTLATPTATVRLVYSGSITDPPDISTPLEVMDDLHRTRSDKKSVNGTVVNDALDVGTVVFDSLDCELWRIGVKILEDLHALGDKTMSPANGLRFKRWSGVNVGTAHTYYDYIPVPTDLMSDTERARIDSRECTLFHEFGHDLWFPVDGSGAHWNGDLMAYGYARSHKGDEITNVHYAFSEGWADYWRLSRRMCPVPGGLPDIEFRDWNEWHVAKALNDISMQPGMDSKAMFDVLRENPGRIHSLAEFVAAAKALHPALMNLPPAPPVCPQGFRDDGATCRRDTVAKPSTTRGAGVVPSLCDSSSERSGALCYPKCPAGMTGNGPVCWQVCPAGFRDDGASCSRDAKIIGADNSACPLVDKCGLTFNRGCSKCPAGFANDGCTCRRNTTVSTKQSRGRGAGAPLRCAAGQQNDAGLCYSSCPAGYTGAGPVCWGLCPANTRDDGATCFQPTLVLIK